MSAVSSYRLRPLLHFSLLLTLSSSPLFVSTSWAETSGKRAYEVPAGSLSAALTRFAGQAGVNLSVDPALVNGRNSSGLSGEFAVEEGFARLLQGSGLQLVPVGEHAYTLIPAPDSASAGLQLAPTSIVGDSGSTDGQEYAGGQVARKGSQGMLGSRDFMETPFSMTTYTKDAVKNQQARTLGDLIASDPSVRATNPAGGRYEQFTIRGFSLFNSDVSYNGLYGILPTYTIDMEMAERVDILKGPSQLINGISPRGSVGGGINVVPKRATDKPITELTTSYASKGQAGAAVDVARRFGEDDKFGIRFNGVKQSGDTEWDHQSVDREMAVLGLDFRGDRLRLSTDIGHTERDTDAPQERVQVGANAKVPNANDVRDNYAQSWSKARTKDTFGAVNAEYDLSDSVMLYGGVGARKSNHDFLRHAVSVTNDAGDFSVQPRDFTRDENVRTATAGARSWFNTGPVSHEVNLAASYFYMDFENGGARYAAAPSNLYNPVDTPTPSNPTRADSKVYTENRFSGVALTDTLGFFDDRLLLTLGARWQRVKVDDWTDNVKGDTSYDEEKVSPSGGILYKVTDDFSVYANYMEGLSQGKIAPSTSVNEDQIFPPFVSRQIEVGAKYDLGSYAFTASVFRIKQPAYETNTTSRVFGPNGKRRNDGVELTMFGEPLKGFRLLGGVMYIDSELTNTVNGTFDGNRAPATPEYNVNLGAEWDVPSVKGLTLTGRGIYTSSQYLDQANSKSIDSSERFDVGARYAFKVDQKDITLRANVENVMNKYYWSSAGASDDSEPGLTLSTPRTYLLSATIGF
ncbi:Outer membrane ferric siderophore receptor [Pseudomonas amygdali pv. mori]|uniref:Outer membrane ferric siderophore receptor n=2 Tax=Pseudomonas amygdali pv. mori TaxID=34065 RepID=A0A0P9WE62_PSEA0|nr:TonB-dependent receptor [Pseudomonas amygdali]EGH23737.1 outer membrane ferric siderophore receptor [Pseudomonas amygdali pv. mori str. 301020]KPX99947.1 Outer membrane ferric siderophore receptor [Pseudomonas amygdali pv. mori]RMQ33059.1 Outer membrane ferric siderophore receptor [Pseudomonas amygdali pv. mori]RMR39599.1 Outer membrane ferric siderophore receptor [Pseudomonas amygdali pv. mori]RMT16469.1 Outer membrane ferric siderophore receptor [Pseudomonas amygdali pv. mori]